jgi:hypothetical protein
MTLPEQYARERVSSPRSAPLGRGPDVEFVSAQAISGLAAEIREATGALDALVDLVDRIERDRVDVEQRYGVKVGWPDEVRRELRDLLETRERTR